MKGATYEFNSTAEIQLTRILGFPNLLTPVIKFEGPTRIRRDSSTLPRPGRFLATTTMIGLDLKGRALGSPVRISLNDSYHLSTGTIEGRADPSSPDPASPEPMGKLKSRFSVYVDLTTPLGTLFNKKPFEMSATIFSIPPKHAKYKQAKVHVDFFDKVSALFAITTGICAKHDVKYITPRPQPEPQMA